MSATETKKANVLLLGGGAVGTIAALNIETGGLGSVTAVLRSNFKVVQDEGYVIESVDHGKLHGWRPTRVVNSVPDVIKESLPPFDYIVTTTKNLPDIPPSLTSLIAPAVTLGHTIIVIVQNGLNIEKPMFASFPTNIVLSGVSMIDAHEGRLGEILHEEHDTLYLGAFNNPNINDPSRELSEAKKFIEIYNAAGKSTVHLSEDVAFARWRKLVFNAVLNPLCAILGLDDARIRLAGGGSAIEGLVRPAMREIVQTARKLGHDLPEEVMDAMIHCDPMDLYLKPSMQCDYEKVCSFPRSILFASLDRKLAGNYMEYEYLVGEPLREAEKIGVPAPTLKVIYEICKALQWRIMEEKGLVLVPPKRVL
ncbi:2-dehydropantoate 2-reductase-like protein [Cadophora sp. MPI-SDFR-AT-0126]|nr:2-dehydropantoate 2-reductase-like protein [Leotiomycetes sp. MPI-SDFR-AT-0126]